MNEATVYRYIAGRLDRMTNEQLDAVRRDCLFVCEKVMNGIEQPTGEPFDEDFEERLAEHLRENPREIERLRADLAEHEQPPRKKRALDDYFEEAWANREDTEYRWDAVRKKISELQFPDCRSWEELNKLMACAELPKAPGLRVAELIAHAELHAGAEHLGELYDTLQDVHLRKQKIDTLASFMARLSNPMAATTDPMETA